MKKTVCLLWTLLLCLPLMHGAELSDTLSIKRVFANVPSKAFDILSTANRLDMADYAEAGSDYSVVNEMYGHSKITSYSSNCITVDISQVSTAQVFTLPTNRGGVAAVIYTVDAGGADSQIQFYDGALQPIKTAPLFKTPSLYDFMSVASRGNKQLRSRIASAVPFEAMRYLYEPQTGQLQVTLTLRDILSREELAEVTELLLPSPEGAAGPSLSYKWDGTSFKLIK